mmetsp:Transcript_30489/g.61425  ORF Transcript_30489/g.61425 Transcript_30489/m.61425 type:complete len:231 (+) Transcript_30489:462-1154(+)
MSCSVADSAAMASALPSRCSPSLRVWIACLRGASTESGAWTSSNRLAARTRMRSTNSGKVTGSCRFPRFAAALSGSGHSIAASSCRVLAVVTLPSTIPRLSTSVSTRWSSRKRGALSLVAMGAGSAARHCENMSAKKASEVANVQLTSSACAIGPCRSTCGKTLRYRQNETRAGSVPISSYLLSAIRTTTSRNSEKSSSFSPAGLMTVSNVVGVGACFSRRCLKLRRLPC